MNDEHCPTCGRRFQVPVNKTEWTSEMLTIFLVLRTHRMSLAYIALELGIGIEPVRRKAKELGLNSRVNFGNRKVRKDQIFSELNRRANLPRHSIRVSDKVHSALATEAEARRTTVQDLAHTLLERILTDNLIRAVLDD